MTRGSRARHRFNSLYFTADCRSSPVLRSKNIGPPRDAESHPAAVAASIPVDTSAGLATAAGSLSQLSGLGSPKTRISVRPPSSGSTATVSGDQASAWLYVGLRRTSLLYGVSATTIFRLPRLGIVTSVLRGRVLNGNRLGQVLRPAYAPRLAQRTSLGDQARTREPPSSREAAGIATAVLVTRMRASPGGRRERPRTPGPRGLARACPDRSRSCILR